MEMQSVTADCDNHAPGLIEKSENTTNALAWYFNHPVNCAWAFVFSGMVVGITGVRLSGLSLILFLLSTIFLLDFIFILINGISDLKIYILCLTLAGLGSSLRYHNETVGFSGIEIRDVVDHRRPRLLTFDGYLIDRETFDQGKLAEPSSRIILKAERMKSNRANEPCRGSILVEARPEQISGIRTGQAVSLTGWLEPLPEAMNPGTYSMSDYWRGRGVHAIINARNHAIIQIQTEKPLIYWRFYLDRIRQRCRNCIKAAVPENQGSLLEALVLGIRESVSQRDRNLFRDSGTLHLLAISGLHLQVIAIFMMWLARLTKCNLVLTAWLVILCSGFYSVLVGGSASVVRATLMTSAVSMSMVRNQPGHFWNRLLQSGCIVIWLNPLQLFDAGCQLSFFGTAGIQFATELWSKTSQFIKLDIYQHPVEQLLGVFKTPEFLNQNQTGGHHKIPAVIIFLMIVLIRIFIVLIRLIAEPLFISLIVWLFTALLVGFHFQSVNPVAILVNLPLVPATSLALIVSLSGMVLSLSGIGLIGNFLIQIAGRLMAACVLLLDWALKNMMAPIAFQSPEMIDLMLIYTVLFLMILIYHSSNTQKHLLNYVLIVLLVVYLPGIHYIRLSRKHDQDALKMHVFAVEHGLSILIRLPDGQNWLYDCGQMGSPAVAEKVVIPALNSIGVSRIDKLFISHADSDHFNGISSLIDSEIKIQSVLTTPHFLRSRQPDAVELKNLIVANEIPLLAISAGEILLENQKCSAKVLHPSPTFSQFKADNSTSLVIEIESNGTNCILTGDLEGAGLTEMTSFRDESDDLRKYCSVLVAPHHGGIQSNPEWFYQTFQPDIVITSQGKGRFGLANSLESRLKSVLPDCRLFVTARDGAIELKWTSDGVKANTFREGNSLTKPLAGTESREGRNTGSAKTFFNTQ